MDAEEMRGLRIGLFALYLASAAAAMVSFFLAGGEPNWLVKTFVVIGGFCFYAWIATFLWWLMPHKLIEYYTSDRPLVGKIFSTVFWLDLPLFILAWGGNTVPKHTTDLSWDMQLNLMLHPYIHYFGGILVFSCLGWLFFGLFTDRISFARPVFIVNRRDRD